MRRLASLISNSLALLLALSGCATTPPSEPSYGNFVPPAAFDQQMLAGDAAQQLAPLYLPARTRLALQQPTPDPFGQALIKSLRDKGYAVVEFPLTAAIAPEAPLPAARQPSAGAMPEQDPLPLRYVLDRVDESNLYRLTLVVGHQSIARAYFAQNGVFTPAGHWTRKE